MATIKKVVVNPRYAHLKDYLENLPYHWDNHEGKVIYKGRNELREIEVEGTTLVIKSFQKPNLINQIAYGFFRSSKAQRSYEHAELFLRSGIGTPAPVGYYTERKDLLFTRSFYACLKSECPYSFNDLTVQSFSRFEEIVVAIARTTALIHDKGYLHKDYSTGNILFRDDTEEIKVEIIDLNRMDFGKVGLAKGCKNFDRLPQTEQLLPILSQTYAQTRGFNPELCYQLMKRHMYKIEQPS